MTYSVKLTDCAVKQIGETVGYISKNLGVPDTAKAWANKLKTEIGALDELPKRFPLVDEEPWRSKDIRKMLVGNFIVYFWTDDENALVWVTAVIYGKRNQIEMLRQMPI